MPHRHRRAMRDIERCRTPAMGGHVYVCPACAQKQYLYHSCRNRHCPKCQHDKAQRWLEAQQELLLPTSYFLLTFTLPQGLRSVARSRQRLVYDLLFRTSAQAMQQLAQNERWVGGQMGMLGVLHTWGRTLVYHPHVHYLVPGGAMGADGRWRRSRANFLLPVKALSKMVRGKFRDGLRQADPALFAQVPSKVWHQDWVVHCQPVGRGLHAIKYLAPYIFRVAISNRRILRMADGRVTFRYRATDTGTLKTCTLRAEEFIRRFLQHVLPRGFVKVRYFGFLSSGLRPRLVALKRQLAIEDSDTGQSCDTASREPRPAEETSPRSSRTVDVRCPSCGELMQRTAFLAPSDTALVSGHPP